MANPALSGIGAFLSQLGGDTMDWRQRQKVMAMQQAQQNTQNEHNAALLALQKANLGETQRSNQAGEADREALRLGQDVRTFSESAGRGGINYLDPKRAFMANQPTPQTQVSDMGIQGSNVMDALNQASRTAMMGSIDPLAKTLSKENRASGFIPGSESIGGATLENKTYNPYTDNSWRPGMATASNESTDWRAAMDDIQKAGDAAATREKDLATNIDKWTDMSQITQRAEAAKAKEMKNRATSWAKYLSAMYPGSRMRYTPEALLNTETSLGTQTPSSQPSSGGNRLIPGGAATPPTPQSVQHAAPPTMPTTRNRLITP